MREAPFQDFSSIPYLCANLRYKGVIAANPIRIPRRFDKLCEKLLARQNSTQLFFVADLFWLVDCTEPAGTSGSGEVIY